MPIATRRMEGSLCQRLLSRHTQGLGQARHRGLLCPGVDLGGHSRIPLGSGADISMTTGAGDRVGSGLEVKGPRSGRWVALGRRVRAGQRAGLGAWGQTVQSAVPAGA